MNAWRNIKVILKRELSAYFLSPIAYIFIIAFLLLNSIKYMLIFFLDGTCSMRFYFDWLPIMLLVFIPPITMRLWAEDKKHGTLETLMTLPIPTWQIVMGKYLSGLIFYIIALILTFPVPLMLYSLGQPDTGAIIGGYIGALLLGAFYLSLGIFISGLFADQILAFIVTLFFATIFSVAGWGFIPSLLDGVVSGLGTFLYNHVGITRHFESIGRGVLDIKDILFFLSYTVAFLFLNVIYLDDRTASSSQFVKSFLTSFAIIILIAFFFNLVVNTYFTGGRIDLTAEKIYTLSSYTKELLQSLKTPVQVSYYVTPKDKMPAQLQHLEEDVRDKLDEFRRASRGKFNYTVYYPDPNSELAQKLLRKNIRAQQVQSIDSSSLELKLAYSCLVISYLNQDDEIIPFVTPDQVGNLEYAIVSRIHKLTYAQDDTDYSDDDLFTLEMAKNTLYPKLEPASVKVIYVQTQDEKLEPRLPANLKGLFPRVKEKLDILARESGGKILTMAFEKSSPEYSSLLTIMARKGLFEPTPIPRDTSENTIKLKAGESTSDTGQEQDLFYSGIYINYMDRRELAIEKVTLDNVDKLIIEINKKISRIRFKKMPKVALYAPKRAPSPEEIMIAQAQGRPFPEGQDMFSELAKMFEAADYQVIRTKFTKDDPLPPDADTILIMEPRELNDRQKYELDAALHEGKKVIMAIGNYDFNFRPSDTANEITLDAREVNPNVNDLLKTYGLEVENKIYMDRESHVITAFIRRPVRMLGFDGFAEEPFMVKKPFQVKVLSQNMNREISFTNQIDTLLFYCGSRILVNDEVLKKNNLKRVDIFRGEEGWTAGIGELNQKMDATPDLKGAPLAVMLTGKFPSKYQNLEVPRWPEDAGKTGEIKIEQNRIVGDTKETSLIVIGASKMFDDNFIKAPNHSMFIKNILDATTLSENLVKIRAKTSSKPMIRRTTEAEKIFWKFIVIGLVPLALAILGGIIITKSHIAASR